MAVGYVIGGVLMAGAGLVEIFLGVDAEQQSLEEIAAPLSAAEETTGAEQPGTAAEPVSPSPVGPYPPPRRHVGRVVWSPQPQASVYPRHDMYLAREVDAIVDALERLSPQSPLQLSRSVAAQYWGRFRTAVRSGLASGRIRRVGRHSLAAASRPPARSLVGADSEYRH